MELSSVSLDEDDDGRNFEWGDYGELLRESDRVGQEKKHWWAAFDM